MDPQQLYADAAGAAILPQGIGGAAGRRVPLRESFEGELAATPHRRRWLRVKRFDPQE